MLDTVAPGPIILIGASLGAAVALQEAATDRRVTGVVAAETFSDLRSVATERAPLFIPDFLIRRAFHEAEQQAGFVVDAVSPAAAAVHITAPVFLIHGAADQDTLPLHSRRVFIALTGPKRFLLVPGARHNESMSGAVWSDIERWVDDLLSKAVAESN